MLEESWFRAQGSTSRPYTAEGSRQVSATAGVHELAFVRVMTSHVVSVSAVFLNSLTATPLIVPNPEAPNPRRSKLRLTQTPN